MDRYQRMVFWWIAIIAGFECARDLTVALSVVHGSASAESGMLEASECETDTRQPSLESCDIDPVFWVFFLSVLR